eukprot:TRINITY_DN127460_c0_g1_i1.p1 TRINITY_DN127460_c0_g1~~TRINITY_DN127460_c0_g1_i1.p1  ORF type:complete len:213 (-),score=42.29 TRINITY_DN127460_c0_g1_i1:85-723(-)
MVWRWLLGVVTFMPASLGVQSPSMEVSRKIVDDWLLPGSQLVYMHAKPTDHRAALQRDRGGQPEGPLLLLDVETDTGLSSRTSVAPPAADATAEAASSSSASEQQSGGSGVAFVMDDYYDVPTAAGPRTTTTSTVSTTTQDFWRGESEYMEAAWWNMVPDEKYAEVRAGKFNRQDSEDDDYEDALWWSQAAWWRPTPSSEAEGSEEVGGEDY